MVNKDKSTLMMIIYKILVRYTCVIFGIYYINYKCSSNKPKRFSLFIYSCI